MQDAILTTWRWQVCLIFPYKSKFRDSQNSGKNNYLEQALWRSGTEIIKRRKGQRRHWKEVSLPCLGGLKLEISARGATACCMDTQGQYGYSGPKWILRAKLDMRGRSA